MQLIFFHGTVSLGNEKSALGENTFRTFIRAIFKYFIIVREANKPAIFLMHFHDVLFYKRILYRVMNLFSFSFKVCLVT